MFSVEYKICFLVLFRTASSLIDRHTSNPMYLPISRDPVQEEVGLLGENFKSMIDTMSTLYSTTVVYSRTHKMCVWGIWGGAKRKDGKSNNASM